jgi:2-methylcitrate dehydratase PrpD
MAATMELARFVANKDFADLPLSAIHQAKLCLLDTLGNMIAASGSPYGKKAIPFFVKNGEQGNCMLIGSKRKIGPAMASFSYGTLADILEAQDGDRFGGIHPGLTVIPAALAIGGQASCSGKDLLMAIVLGYEVASRIGASVHPEKVFRGFGGTGTCGIFGAIAASGKILRFTEKELAFAYGIGGFLAPISSYESLFEPNQKIKGFLPIKSILGGMAAYTGVLSVLLASEGFAGSPEILETTRRGGFLHLLSDSPNFGRISEGLGERYQIQEVYLKPYTACRHTHGGIQAALQIVAERQQTFKEFDKVRVRTYRVGKAFVGDRYTTPESSFVTCQFSLPYMVTVALLDGEVGPKQISDVRIADARVHELARRVTVDEDPSFTKGYPEKTSTAIDVYLKDGDTISQFVEIPKGDPRNPLSLQEVQAKFARLTKRLLSLQSRKNLFQAVEHLDEMKNIRSLTQLFSPMDRRK